MIFSKCFFFFVNLIAISKNFFGMRSVNIQFVPVWWFARAEQYAKLNKFVLPNKLRKRRPVRKKSSIVKKLCNKNSISESETIESETTFSFQQQARLHKHMLSFQCNEFADDSYCIRIRFVFCTGQRSTLLLLEIKLHLLSLFFILLMRFKFVLHWNFDANEQTLKRLFKK